MREYVNALVPDFMKFMSVGSTIGISLGLCFSYFLSDNTKLYVMLFFMLLSITGFWQVKDVFINYFKT